ncbi:MAG: winged helix-turn-helix domain-containing protein [Acidimicrobiales bacterium]
MTASDLGVDGVAFIPWPGPPVALQGAAGPGRLYLVESGAELPPVEGCLEDWVRLPASEEDISARATALLKRLRFHSGQERPHLDSMGILHMGDRWVDLPPLEARLFRLLLDRLGEAVATDELLAAGWGSGTDSRGNLRIQVLRLRRRLAQTGLSIHTLPGRGYMLEAKAPTA